MTHLRRRTVLLRFGALSFGALSLGGALSLTGCSGAPVVATRWYQLPADPPVAPATASARPQAGTLPVWELSARVALPGALDRDAVTLVRGSEVQVLENQRWAEPLRDSVPAVLRADLERLRGNGSVWLAPAPPGTAAAAQLRVEVAALEATSSGLRVLARWWLSDGRTAPTSKQADFTVPMAGSGGDAVVAAYRLALWRLAERIAQG